MEFKSRFVRGLPVLALMASLLVPFKPVAAAEGPYTAAPGVSAAPSAQITAGNSATGSDELDAAGKLRDRGHGKKRLLTAATDDLDAAGKLRHRPRDKKPLLTAATDDLDAAGRLKRRQHDKKPLLTAATDDLDAAGKLRDRRHGRKGHLIAAASDETKGSRRHITKPRHA